MNERHNSGLSAKTVKHLRDCLRAALNVAVKDWNLITRNPAANAKPPSPDKPKLRVFDLNEARAFLEIVAGHRLEALFSVALLLGPRQGEVLGLRWSDIDFENRTLMISGALKRIGGKLTKHKTKAEGSIRTVGLPAVTMSALLHHRAQQELNASSPASAGRTRVTYSPRGLARRSSGGTCCEIGTRSWTRPSCRRFAFTI